MTNLKKKKKNGYKPLFMPSGTYNTYDFVA